MDSSRSFDAPCGHINPPHYRFCDICGARLPAPCPRCQTANRVEANFCGGCGFDLRETSGPSAELATDRSEPDDITADVPPPETARPRPSRASRAEEARHRDPESRRSAESEADLAELARLERMLEYEDRDQTGTIYRATGADGSYALLESIYGDLGRPSDPLDINVVEPIDGIFDRGEIGSFAAILEVET